MIYFPANLVDYILIVLATNRVYVNTTDNIFDQ